ncbi:MAG: hypothetical protein ACQESK_00950 [Bacteroidota bacterium]
MQLKAYIDENIQAANLSTSIDELMQAANSQQLKNLPVQDRHSFLGCISIEDIEGLEPKKELNEYRYLIRNFVASISKSDIDLLRKFAENETDILPFLNEDHQYIGSLRLSDFLSYWKETPFLSYRGEEIMVQKKRVDFTYSELCQLIESNSAKLLGIYTHYVDQEKIQLYLRIDHNGLNSILESLRRFDYEIVSIHKDDQHIETLRENAAYFEKFLNI